jgi:hypothetical protein
LIHPKRALLGQAGEGDADSAAANSNGEGEGVTGHLIGSRWIGAAIRAILKAAATRA